VSRSLAAVVALCLLLLPSVPSRASPTLFFTGALNGRLEGCDCKASPAPGLSKIAAWIRAERRASDLLLDAGDVLDGWPDAGLEEAILQSYVDLGYAAVAVGENDLGAGPLKILAGRGRLPFLCNNLSILDPGSGWAELSPEPLLSRAGDRSFGILALLESEALPRLDPETRALVRLADPVARAAELVGELRRGGASTVILLYHGGRASLLPLLERVSGIDIALAAHDGGQGAVVVGRTVVAGAGGDGRRVFDLDLGRSDPRARAASLKGRLFDARFGPDEPSVLARLEAYRAELRARLRSPGP